MNDTMNTSVASNKLLSFTDRSAAGFIELITLRLTLTIIGIRANST